MSQPLSQIVAKGAKTGKTQKFRESEESLCFTGCFVQSSGFQRVAKMAYFGFTVCPVWPLRYLSTLRVETRISKSEIRTRLLRISIFELRAFSYCGFGAGDGNRIRRPCQILRDSAYFRNRKMQKSADLGWLFVTFCHALRIRQRPQIFHPKDESPCAETALYAGQPNGSIFVRQNSSASFLLKPSMPPPA